MSTIGSRRTPYNDAYETCERVAVQLLIYPGDLHPDRITKWLQVAPSQTQILGQQIANSLGRTRTVGLNGWFLSSENEVQSMDLRRHLDWLVERLRGCHESLERLQAEPGVKMGVKCIWWSAHGQGGPTLWPEQMQGLADLNLECSFDIGFYGDDED